MFHSCAVTGGAPRVFFDTERHAVPIHDMRPLAGALSLDHEGFELLPPRDRRARPLRRRCGRAGLLPGDRGAAARGDRGQPRRRSSMPRGAPTAAPARGTATACAARRAGCTSTTPRRAARSGSRTCSARPRPTRLAAAGARIVQINVWRPIRGPVQRSPLALADASSVRPEDLIATDQVFPDRVGEIYHLAYHPGSAGTTRPQMTPDEVLLIKGWDSLDGRPRPVHAARRLRPAGHARRRAAAREHRGAHARGDRGLRLSTCRHSRPLFEGGGVDMKIGIIGAGQIGGTLTRRLTALGHDVSVANSRGPETLAALAAGDRREGRHGPRGGARRRRGHRDHPAEERPRPAGRICSRGVARQVVVVDTGNYYPQQRDGRIDAIEEGMTESRWVEQQLGRPVVKAFNNIYAEHLLERGKPAGAPGRIALPVAGDDRGQGRRDPADRRARLRWGGRRQSGRLLAAAAGHAGLRHRPRRRGRPAGAGRGHARAHAGVAGHGE